MTLYRKKILYNKTNRRTNFPNLFLYKTLHVSGSSSAHHQEYCTFGTGTCYTGLTTAFVHTSFRQTCITRSSAECTVLLMMGRETARNM